MVQKARLDLTAVVLALTVLAGPASAQEGPLTTLMRAPPPSGPSLLGGTDALARHDRLSGESPLTNTDTLANEDLLSGSRPPTGKPTDPAKPGERAQAACDPRAGRPRAPAVGVGGSGPGEYAQFVDHGSAPGQAGPQARSAAGLPGDHALYGGTDRPLWSDGAQSQGRKPGQRATAARPVRAAAGEATSSDTRAATPGVDRPLWVDSSAVGGTTVDPCGDDVAMQRAVAPPVQTLFFGTVPAH